jgi:hypothetical protein
MKNVFLAISLCALIWVAVGCSAKGFNRGELKSMMGANKAEYSDGDIKAAFSKKSNLPKQFKLAVYFSNPTQTRTQKWRWEDSDKVLLEDIGKELKTQGVLAEIFTLSDATISGTDLKSLRMAAAQHQADALLIISGAGSTDRYLTNWGGVYAFLLPVFFVPASKVDTLFIANATMWDVRNEFLYLTAEGEATTSQSYIAAFGPRDQTLLKSAKSVAVTNLRTEVINMIKGKKL